MRRILNTFWFVAVSLWAGLGLLIAFGVVSTSGHVPWAGLAAQAALWILPPLAAWGLWRLALRSWRFCRSNAPEAARAAGRAVVLTARAVSKLA